MFAGLCVVRLARWKIKKETFNPLKNKGYHFGHNFSLGKQHLSEVFVLLLMLAFLLFQFQAFLEEMENKEIPAGNGSQ